MRLQLLSGSAGLLLLGLERANLPRRLKAIQEIIGKQIDTLTAYRKSLIHECVTGQRRISAEDLAGVGARLPEAEACA